MRQEKKYSPPKKGQNSFFLINKGDKNEWLTCICLYFLSCRVKKNQNCEMWLVMVTVMLLPGGEQAGCAVLVVDGCLVLQGQLMEGWAGQVFSGRVVEMQWQNSREPGVELEHRSCIEWEKLLRFTTWSESWLSWLREEALEIYHEKEDEAEKVKRDSDIYQQSFNQGSEN